MARKRKASVAEQQQLQQLPPLTLERLKGDWRGLPDAVAFARSLNFDAKHGTLTQSILPDIHLTVVRLYPNIQVDADDRVFHHWARYQGIILETYGAGDAPQSIIDILIRLRVECHIAVCYVTECYQGAAKSSYAVSVPDRAAVCLQDMTAACAYARLAVTLSAFTAQGLTGKQRREAVEAVMAVPMRDAFRAE